MKRFFTVILCVFLTMSLIGTVSATDSASMTISGSASTAKRGDTIHFTVSISKVEDCRSAAFMLTYDTSVFEFVKGSCSLSGTALASFSNGTGTFAYSEGTTVSGQIFTFTLKVKSNAPMGKASISANVNTRDSNGAIPTSVNTLSVNVQCDHSYDSWKQVDGNNHKHTCTLCGKEETASHTWDKGKVTKAPTCQAEGEKTFTCTACGATKTETVAKSNDHSYGQWSRVDGTNHKHTCTLCGKEETASHTWDKGKVTKAPTCQAEGENTYTCTACGATKTEIIAKSNDHSYGQWSKVDGTNHKRACTLCGKEETASHTWDKGKVTKAPTCKAEGEKTFTCTACGATKTETIAKSNDHSYGQWSKVDGTNHKRACTLCGKEETASHTWNKGKVTKAPTCKAEGEKTFTCTACGATKTETVAVTTDHAYGKWTKVNDQSHKHTCGDCGKEETTSHTWNKGTVTKKATCKAEGEKTYTCTGCGATKVEIQPKNNSHTYDNGCDADCNLCGSKRTVSHTYGSDWNKDANSHWLKCTVCGEKKDTAPHTPGAAATEENPQTCTLCGYVLAPALTHEHHYADVWTSDETAHWYACDGCEVADSYEIHVFDHGCDPDCGICGYTREIAHDYGTALHQDSAGHWLECTVCGASADLEAHVPGAEATTEAPQTCVVCGWELAPTLPVPEPADNDFPWVIVLGVAAVIAGGAVLVLKKRKA